MSSSTTTSSLVRIVGETNSLQAVQDAIFEHFQQSPTLLQLENKYFTSRVVLTSAVTTTSSDDHDLMYKEDGVILVCDANALTTPQQQTTTATFESFCKSIHATLLETAPDLGDLLRLCCVSHPTNMPSISEDEYSKRILWCLDHGYEYVEINLSQVKEGHDDRDKDGFARVIEALEGTVWSSAIMKKKKSKPQQSSIISNTTNDAVTTNNNETSTVADSATETKEQDGNFPTIPSSSSSYVPPSIQKEEQSPFSIPHVEEDEEDRSMQQLENLMKEATRIRDASIKGELSDEERRKRAAEAASLMMGLMMNDSDDEDDDSQED